MAVSRKRLFERSEPEHPLTPHKLRLLLLVAENGILTVPQLSSLSGLSEKSVRNHMRDLYDLGLVNRAGVPRSALADISTPNAMELLYGRAPTIYSLTHEAVKTLVANGFISQDKVRKDVFEYGPKNSLFLAHELQIRDFKVWLGSLKTRYPHHTGLVEWKTGTEAIIDLGRNEYPKQVRPDAWFVYKFTGKTTLVGFLEIDRGTERSPSRFQEKFTHYEVLFASGKIQELTGQMLGRVLIITPDAARTETLARVLEAEIAHSRIPSDRFWITERESLKSSDLSALIWKTPERSELLSLVTIHNL